MEKQRQIQFRPRIESLVYEPGTVGQVANGVLAPGGHVTLFGVHFGEQTGEIYMWGNESELGLPEGRLTTQVKEWADNRVRVAVRPNTLQGPLYRSSIWFRVVPPTREGSVPYKAPFEVPSEVRTLGDAAVAASVEAIECSDGANENHCDGSKVLATHENIMVPHNPFDPDGGVDRWRIRLFEGWTFRDSRLHVRSGHAELARKPSPGGSEWEGGVSWACSIQETAKYELDVKVQRPSRPRDPLGVEQLE